MQPTNLESGVMDARTPLFSLTFKRGNIALQIHPLFWPAIMALLGGAIAH